MKIVELPRAAIEPWQKLQKALIDTTTPCAADPELWCSDNADDRAWAAQRCQGCAVLGLCDQYARAAKETFGVFGGKDRTQLKRGPGRPRKSSTERKTA